jgi:hypothetical protein
MFCTLLSRKEPHHCSGTGIARLCGTGSDGSGFHTDVKHKKDMIITVMIKIALIKPFCFTFQFKQPTTGS